MSSVLVVNSGSSSLKYQLLDSDTEQVLAKGLIERIGEAQGARRHTTGDGDSAEDVPVPDHAAAFRVMIDAFAEHGPQLGDGVPAAVGHRVVQGGDRYNGPALVTDRVLADIEELSALAPLHNPPGLAGIRAATDAFPGVPQVAVFDTAFHATLPPAAYTYAIDREVAAEHGIRRYGFHGTSHSFVSRRAAEFLGLDPATARIIVLHLGNGASVCAVDGGRSVETSMGLTPLEGLVMGTRSGDLDPAVLLHLERTAGFDADALDALLNRRSGLQGLAGHADIRDVQAAAREGDDAAQLALDVYVHRLERYLGAYLAHLGGADAIVFTAGVGEHNPRVRERAVEHLGFAGVALDPDRNTAGQTGDRLISSDSSRVAVLVIPTNEELEIARQAAAVVSS